MTKRPSVVKRERPKPEPDFKLYAPTGAGMEEVLAKELRRIGAERVSVTQRGVAFAGDLGTIYRANLKCRTAHRILLELAEFEAPNREALYEGTAAVDWFEHMTLENTLAVDGVSHRSELSHTQFVSRVVKDAIVDNFRRRTGRRPDVDPKEPDLKLNVHLSNDRCTLSVDTSGERLHRRGYRPTFGVDAPIKETLAAAICLLSNYDGNVPFVDPMCGSGTLVVEAALIARNIAPGLLGRNFGFQNHPTFNKRLWKDHVEEAKEAIRKDDPSPVFGSDIDENALRSAAASCQGAGVDDLVRLRKTDITDLTARDGGIIVTNPPYGERLGEIEQLGDLYRLLGDTFKFRCAGMSSHVLTGSKYLAGRIGLRPKSRDILWNGPIECRLLHFDLY